MKRNVLTVLVGIIFLACVTAFGQTETKVGKKPSEVLEKILTGIEKGKVPAEIYPPGMLEGLAKKADEGDKPLPVSEESSKSKSVGMAAQRLFNPLIQKFQVIDLGTLGGNVSKAYGINEKGQVIGVSYTSAANDHAFLWSNGFMQDLGTLGGNVSMARGINNHGEVVGLSLTGSGFIRAFIWSNSIMSSLGTLGGNHSWAFGINDNRKVVGYSKMADGTENAFSWSNGSLSNLGTLGEPYSRAYAINKNGQIAGYSAPLGQSYHICLWSDGSTNDLGTLGGFYSYAYGMNDNGQIVGLGRVGDYEKAFLYSEGSTYDLGSLGGIYSAAYGINNYGQVVGSSYHSGSSTHAFLYQNSVMYDLNDLVATNISPGWILEDAQAINENGQIVGSGINPSGQIRAFLLNPLPEGFESILDTQLPKPVFGNYPTKGVGKESLVLVTHGWINKQFNPLNAPNPSWIEGLTNSIRTSLASRGLTNWQVSGYKWVENAWTFQAPNALVNAKQEGFNLGSALSVQGWSNVHLIGHSTGAQVIQQATEAIKSVSPSTIVHCTFLDAYVGNDKAGVTNYGKGTDWSDSYFSQDLFTGKVTEQCLSNAYNVEVTLLDPFKIQGIAKIPSSDSSFPVTICHITGSSHEWPYYYYSNTITGNTNLEYQGLGFPLSMEGGNWSHALNSFPTGNIPARILGTDDCSEEVPLTPRTWLQWKADFSTMPTLKSTSGSIQKWLGSLKLNPGSPVWSGSIVNPTNPINTLTFDAVFVGTNGSDSLLSVYWDTNVIGTITESKVNPGFQHYSLSFPQAIANSAYVLGFRLDPYTNALSSAIVTNVTLTQIGVSELFSLSIKTNSSNGLIYELKGEAGYNYTVQASANLTDWVPIAQLANTNGLVRFNDQGSTNYSQRFYRAVVPN